MKSNEISFGTLDYVVFFGMVLLSGLIGIYFGCFGRKQISLNDYLFGGKNMKIFPIVLSLTSSYVSGSAIVGTPTEIYQYGPYYWFSAAAIIVVTIAGTYITLPVFYNLQLISAFEYLERRFDSKTQRLCAIFFTIQSSMVMPMSLYSPAISLAIGMSLDFHILTVILSVTCIFYTTLGGFKAVIWTDALQFVVMIAALIAVCVTGTIKEGGIVNVFKIAYAKDRLSVDFDMDPTKRDTFWTATIGITTIWFISQVIPISIQRFQALPKFSDVKKASWLYMCGVSLFMSMISYIGYLCFARFHDCDPKIAGKIERIDQLLSYYVMDLTNNIPGFSGLFMAGIFSASLSTVSAFLNSLSATIHKDFISPFLPKDLSEETVNKILKGITVLVGIVCVGLVFVMEKLGDMIPLLLALASIVISPLTGIFLLGMLVPKCNAKGAFWGGLISCCTLVCMCCGNYYYSLKGFIIPQKKPFSAEECNPAVNISRISSFQTKPSDFQPIYLFRISFYYYSFIGITLTLILGYLISKITKQSSKCDKELISPIMQWTLPKIKEEVKLLEMKS